ncbi:MAG: PhoH family protein [Acidimicrobiia bacterium]|nr:PhoH family protein [Acidimicrobiia bacterium]
MSSVTEQPASRCRVTIPGNHLLPALLGPADRHLRLLEAAYPQTGIHVRGNEVTASGPDAPSVARVLEELITLVRQGQPVDSRSVVHVIDLVDADESPSEVLNDEVLRHARGSAVRPRSRGQKMYVDAIRSATVTFAIGPAGTGKSWLAVAAGIAALQAREVERIILTRPAVEAGERLGFLPGDVAAKVDPYLRPLYDALYDMLDLQGVQRLLEQEVVEVAPLAFMRGRTLNRSFIILDEAQNTTPEQMKMFLTRIGFGSRAVITGDVTQVDVAGGRSGLDNLETLLAGIEGVRFVHLSSRDVVRHPIVTDIVNAYDKASSETGGGPGRDRSG